MNWIWKYTQVWGDTLKINGTDIYMTRGDTEAITVVLHDKNEDIIPFASGDTVYFTVKQSTQTTIKSFQKVVTVFTPEGEAVIEIDPEDTKTLKYDDYVYDVQMVRSADGVTTVIPPSKFTIGEEVTYE